MKKIKAIIILAGGDGTRFWPLQDKNLFSFRGKALLLRLVDQVRPLGEVVYVVTSTNTDEAIKKILPPGVETIVQDSGLQGMAGAVLAFSKHTINEALILNANDIIDFSVLPTLVDKAQNEKLKYVFLAKKVESYFPGGYLQLENEKLTGIIEKPDPDKVPSAYINLVVDYFTDFPEFLAVLQETSSERDDRFEQALTRYISKGTSGYLPYDGPWSTIKYPWHILSMMGYFLKDIKTQTESGVSIAKTAVIEGEVYLGKNVKIGSFAKISGPCFIDEGTSVGDYAMIRQSHIGKNCLIGAHSEIARSYISDKVSLHRNYIGDSVLGENVLFGAQAVTANFRFDGKDIGSRIDDKQIDTQMKKLGAVVGNGSKIGVNSTILPGVKIGANTHIGPASLVQEDIQDNQFYFKGVVKQNKNL